MIFLETYINSKLLVDFSNLNRDQDLFSKENQNKVGRFEIEIPRSIWIDEFVCLRSKAYSFRYGNDSKNNLKGISKSQ